MNRKLFIILLMLFPFQRIVAQYTLTINYANGLRKTIPISQLDCLTIEKDTSIEDGDWKLSQPLISVIDDDTLYPDHIIKFHDVCQQNGIIGTYACITSRFESNPEIARILHEYEKEGFHVATHCYEQCEFYRSETHDSILVRHDLEHAVKNMEEEGLFDFEYFVAPYGSHDNGLQNIVRDMGFTCLVSIVQQDYLGNDCKHDRYFIPRFGFNSEDSAGRTLSQLKKLIDSTSKNKGWLLVGTHIYNGWTEELLQTRFKEFVYYAKSKGLKFVTLKEGFEQYESVFKHYNK